MNSTSRQHKSGMMGDAGRMEHSQLSTNTKSHLANHLLFQHQGTYNFFDDLWKPKLLDNIVCVTFLNEPWIFSGSITGNPSKQMSTENRLLTQCPLSMQTTKVASDTKNRLLANLSSSLSNFKNLNISSSNLLNKSIHASSFVETENQPSSPISKRYLNTYPILFLNLYF